VGQSAKKLYIAIVDDEPSLREAIKSLLRSAGFRAIAFASAEEFLDYRPLNQIACLILDVRLPGMSGLELQRHLAGLGCKIPIAFVTSLEDRDGRIREQAMRAGAVAVLPKPFSDEQLLSVVRSVVDR
jgi:FixJ family two-component response regulator